MQRLFLFFYQYRAFFTFLFLELVCAWLIIGNNPYQGARFFNSSNGLVATLNNVSHGVREYFLLRQINSTLAEENAQLRSKFEAMNQRQYLAPRTVAVIDSTMFTSGDSAVINQFDFVSAKVVSNTVNRFTNFITINKGREDGVEPGMAVISAVGAVGKVRTVSRHYSVVTSILHVDVQVSALLKRTGHFGTIQWDGVNPDYVKFKFIPRHVQPVKGDSVLTSGYNAIFPEGIMVGQIEEINLSDELFYDLKVKLSQDFRKLAYVEVVKNSLRHELDSLEQPFKEVSE
ncbi:MAG TPA: rod shape-determining protein MreC [Chryseosolibacter sp.]|nr:rod shape-determining protein MreC [Chryseosolibacter sp.]